MLQAVKNVRKTLQTTVAAFAATKQSSRKSCKKYFLAHAYKALQHIVISEHVQQQWQVIAAHAAYTACSTKTQKRCKNAASKYLQFNQANENIY